MKMEQIISRVPIHNSLHNVRLFPSVCKNINTFNVNILKSTMYTHRKKNLQSYWLKVKPVETIVLCQTLIL